jgi:hypothetical protein
LQTLNKFVKDHYEAIMSVLLKHKELQYAKLLLYLRPQEKELGQAAQIMTIVSGHNLSCTGK